MRGGQAFKRGRGHPDPPPPPQSGREWRSMTRPGMDAPGRRSHNPTPPEVLTQARPPAATPAGAGQGGARTVRCTDFGGAPGDHGGPGPIWVSLFNIVLPPCHTHAHPHREPLHPQIVEQQTQSTKTFKSQCCGAARSTKGEAATQQWASLWRLAPGRRRSRCQSPLTSFAGPGPWLSGLNAHPDC